MPRNRFTSGTRRTRRKASTQDEPTLFDLSGSSLPPSPDRPPPAESTSSVVTPYPTRQLRSGQVVLDFAGSERSSPDTMESFLGGHGLEKMVRVKGPSDDRGVAYVKGQVQFLTEFFSNRDNYCIRASTGSGKSYVALQAIARELVRGHRALFLTPTQVLVNQICRDALDVLYLDRDSIAPLSGQLNPRRRSRFYGESGFSQPFAWYPDDPLRLQYVTDRPSELDQPAGYSIRFSADGDPARPLLVSTPEVILNDLMGFTPQEFGLLIVDEAHLAVGNYAYVELIKAFRSAGVRILAMSAQEAKDDPRRDELMRLIGAPGVSPLEVDPHLVVHKTRWFDLDPGLKDPDILLREAAELCVHGYIGQELEGYTPTLDAPLDQRTPGSILRERKQLLGALPPSGKLRALCRKICFDRNGYFKMPSAKEYTSFHAKIKSLRPDKRGQRSWWWAAYSMTCELGKLRHHHTVLTTSGREAYQNAVAADLAAVQAFEARGRKGPKVSEYIQRILGEGLRGRAVADIIARQVARRSYWDHAKLEGTLHELATTFRAPNPGHVILFSSYAHQARFMSENINRLNDGWTRIAGEWVSFEGARSTWIAGHQHMSRKDLSRNLASFRSGDSNVLVMTSVGLLGLDIKKAKTMLEYSPLTDALENIQLQGRVGRKTIGGSDELIDGEQSGLGRVIHFVTRGTQDEIRHYAGRSSAAAIERKQRENL